MANRLAPVGVTSIDLSAPSIISVSGTPITTRGTIALSLASQSGNLVLCSPDGSSGTPSFRALASGDIPSLNCSKLTAGTLALARGGTNTDNSSVTANQVWAGPSSGGAASAGYRALVAADIPTSALGNLTIPIYGQRAIGGSAVSQTQNPLGYITETAVSKAWMATSGGTSYTDVTTALNNTTTSDVSLAYAQSSDAFYVGYTSKFYAFEMIIGTSSNWNISIVWEYYNGSSWVSFPAGNYLADGTIGGGNSTVFGVAANTTGNEVRFVPPSNWAATTVNGSASLYWIRARASSVVAITTTPSLTQGWVKPLNAGNGFTAPCAGTITSAEAIYAPTATTTKHTAVLITNTTAGTYGLFDITTYTSTGRSSQTVVASVSGLNLSVSSGDTICFLTVQSDASFLNSQFKANLQPA